MARPLGGAVFGHFGNRIGRKAMLIFSLLVMGAATVLIGLLPGYAAIGVAAPILLVVLRFYAGLQPRRRVGRCGPVGDRARAGGHAPEGKRAFCKRFLTAPLQVLNRPQLRLGEPSHLGPEFPSYTLRPTDQVWGHKSRPAAARGA